MVVAVVVVLTAVGCMADILLGVTAEVTGESVEMFVITAGTVRLNCCACGLIVTPVAFRLSMGPVVLDRGVELSGGVAVSVCVTFSAA